MKINQKIRKNQQKGYSLIELSVALSIVAVVIVAGLVGARQVLLSNSVNSQIRGWLTVVKRPTAPHPWRQSANAIDAISCPTLDASSSQIWALHSAPVPEAVGR